MSYQRHISTKGIKVISLLPVKQLTFTGCSNHCVSTGNIAGKWETVYNAIDFSQYQLNKSVSQDAPLMFLGRLDKIKGVHTAIKVAKITHNKLLIGGNISHLADDYQYFKTQIEPQIDGTQIQYLGALNDMEKNHYLGQSKALLFPIEWDEPFGIVMIEAMACGTPVIAFNRGSVPEVVDEKTGIIVQDVNQMCSAVEQVTHINRALCKDTAEAKFDIRIIAKNYLALKK